MTLSWWPRSGEALPHARAVRPMFWRVVCPENVVSSVDCDL